MADDDSEDAFRKWEAKLDAAREKFGREWERITFSITERAQALFDAMKIDADPALATEIASIVFGHFGPPSQQEDDATSGSGMNAGGYIIPPLAVGRFYCRQLYHWLGSLHEGDWLGVQERRAEFPEWEDWYTSFDDSGFFPAATEPEPEMWRLAAGSATNCTRN